MPWVSAMRIPSFGALCLVLASQAWGNGGGYHYGVAFTGGIAPFEPSGTSSVRIVDEKLDIKLEADHAAVEVRYRMRNETDQAVKVRFGFPVEVVHEDLDESGDAAEKNAGPAKTAGKYCRNYSVTTGKSVSVSYVPEPFNEGKVKAFPGSEKLAGIQGWNVSELKFDKGQEQEVVIRYESSYDKVEVYVSDDENVEPLTFRYRLSTGGVWKDSIAKGAVTISAPGVDPDEVVIRKPAGRFEKKGKGWTWNFENLEPTLEDDLVIEAVPGHRSFGGGFSHEDHVLRSHEQRAGVWSLVTNDYKATASSTLAKQGENEYSASNLAPRERDDHHQVWAEGAEGDGVGESLLLTPKRTSKLYGISITPGYVDQEGKGLFEANNRPSLIDVELNDEFKMQVSLRDAAEGQFFRIKGYAKPVKSVKLTIRGVHRGKKWKDTCISRVLLHERLDKEPKVQGAR